MGLDNGITMRGPMPTEDESLTIPNTILEEMKFNDTPRPETYDIDLCYWRKYWGTRSEIASIINRNGGAFEDNDTSILTLQDLYDIRKVLIDQLDIDKWDDNCIWSWDEGLPHIGDKLWKLSWAIEWLKTHKDETVVEFYDSY